MSDLHFPDLPHWTHSLTTPLPRTILREKEQNKLIDWDNTRPSTGYFSREIKLVLLKGLFLTYVLEHMSLKFFIIIQIIGHITKRASQMFMMVSNHVHLDVK